ncbi:MAG: YicC family protein [Proteobacteria bacterium]|nr:YicC family protein [Pseudomonadota bacterium]
MVKSMTGYGRGEALLEGKKIITEIKSVNHRFCDITLKLPRRFSPFEADLKKLISSHAPRGKIDVTVQFENSVDDTSNLTINLPLAKSLCGLLGTLKKELALADDISLSNILAFKDIISPEKENHESQNDWDTLRASCVQAVEALQHMQETEGRETVNDLRSRLGTIKQVLDTVALLFPRSLAERQQTVRDRVKKLCEGVAVDESRMIQEIALMSDKSDITEELIRAKSHLKQFDEWLDTSEPAGRKLDFLLQEINREVNTVGSKASDAAISLNVVLIKNELEKIREQVQNIL